MKELLELIARGLVEQPDAVVVEQDEPTDDGLVVLHLHVAEGDMGRVIGKQGNNEEIARESPHYRAQRRHPLTEIESAQQNVEAQQTD